MKKVFIAVMALAGNALLFSCSTDTLAETDEWIHLHTTEGDDKNMPPPPPSGDQ